MRPSRKSLTGSLTTCVSVTLTHIILPSPCPSLLSITTQSLPTIFYFTFLAPLI